MAENFPNLSRGLYFQDYEAYRSPKIFNSKISSPRYFTIKLSKFQENLKSSKKKFFSHTRDSHKAMSTFLGRNLGGQDAYNCTNSQNLSKST